MLETFDNYYAVIMAGGGGTRLWPLSRKSKPKQLLKLFGDRTLFQIAVDRLDGLFPADKIFVVTGHDQAAELMKICPQIPQSNYILEPSPKNTAAAIGLAAINLHKMDNKATMAVLTADHYIKNEGKFHEAMRIAFDASQGGHLVTLGIEPTYPATGYGYIQRGPLLHSDEALKVYQVERFKEKPDLESARKFYTKGDHDWNSGMFVWKTERILKEFAEQMPELSVILTGIYERMGTQAFEVDFKNLWCKITPQSIDYGIMEHASDVVVIPISDLGWNDVGSWDSLFEVLENDHEGNIIQHDNCFMLNTRNTFIHSQEPDRLVVTIGIENLIIIQTEDALLVCKREDAQEVRKIVNMLKEENKKQYL